LIWSRSFSTSVRSWDGVSILLASSRRSAG
jgi:hypothetical protein